VTRSESEEQVPFINSTLSQMRRDSVEKKVGRP
jgi:hypothetical protein